jgi:hypothetical protein
MAMIDAAAAGMLVRVVIGMDSIGAVNAGFESGSANVNTGWVGWRVRPPIETSSADADRPRSRRWRLRGVITSGPPRIRAASRR